MLFVFVATLGFVIFAFSGVGATYRPVAEAVIPVTLFGGSRFLQTRGAPFVSASLELLAGAITPVVLFAAFVDDSGFPPDLEEGALVAALTGVALVLAAIYAFIGVRRPESLLRYLAAPMVWVAAAVIGLAFESEPSASQFALASWAVVATAAVARLRSDAPLARPTLAVAGPGIVVAYVLTVTLSMGGGWQPIPVIVAGAAAIAMVELLAARIPYPWAVQGAVVAISGAVAAVEWGVAPIGVSLVASYLLLAEWWARRDPDDLAVPSLIAAAAIGVLVTVGDRSGLLAAAALGSVWAHVRRFRPSGDGMRAMATAGAVALPYAMAPGLVDILGAAGTLLMAGALAGAVAVAARLARSEDEFYPYWAAGLSVVVLIGTASAATTDESAGLLAGAAALASLAVAVGPGLRSVRAWVAGVGALSAALLALEALSVSREVQPGVVAIVAAVAAIAALLWRREPAGHVAALAHLVGFGALLGVESPGVRLVAVSAFTAGWLAETVAHETVGSALAELIEPFALRLRGGATLIRGLAPSLTAVAAPLLMADAADQSGFLVDERGRMALLLAALAMAYALVARFTRKRRPLPQVAAVGGFILAAISIAVAAPEPWPTIVATATPIAVVALIGGGQRRSVMVWTAWSLSALLGVLLAERFGAPPEQLHFVLLGWGVTALIGGLLVDDVLAGRREVGEGIRRSALIKPVALGAVAIPVALSFVFSDELGGWWLWAVAAGFLYLVVALQLRAGGVSAAAYSLVALGIGALSASNDYSPIDEPWMFVAGAGVLGVVAFVLERLTANRDAWLGWDVAPLVVAHSLAAVGLVAAVPADAVPIVWSATGGLVLAFAIWKARVEWAVAGIALVLIGASVAGHGWLALALGGTAGVVTIAAVFYEGPVRVFLQWLGAGTTGWAWVETAIWADWWPDTALAATVIGAGALALLIGVARRSDWIGDEWVWPWGALAACATVTVIAFVPAGSRAPVGWSVAGGLVMWSVAAALSARPLAAPWLREASAVALVATGLSAAYATAAEAGEIVAVGIGAGIAATLSAVATWRWRAESPWARPLVVTATLANASAGVAAASMLPDRSLMVTVLAAAGLQAIAAGAQRRTRDYFHAGVALLLSSWLTFASDALSGNPHWFTIPIGLAVIVMVDLTRWDRNRPDSSALIPDLSLVDYLGMAFFVGSSLVQAVTISAAFGVLAMGLGALLCGWAAVTKLRRRLYGGIGAVVLGAALVVAVPVARIIPEFRGLALWATLFGVGAVMILTATYLERGRARVRLGVRRLEDILEDWE